MARSNAKARSSIIDRESGRIIGSSRYCNLDPKNGEVEVGWTFLERQFWGGIYNRELTAIDAESCFSICRSRPVRRWRKEPSIAKSAGKDRRQISKESASSRS
jgi:hypothetical protein